MPEALYTARAQATGGRSGGGVRSDDGKLDVPVEPPTEIGGSGEGTNPEQLFAAGYAACFLSTLKVLAVKRELPMDGASVDASVDLFNEGRHFGLSVSLAVKLPGVERELAERLTTKAHQLCPYSNATRGNVEVDVSVTEPAPPGG